MFSARRKVGLACALTLGGMLASTASADLVHRYSFNDGTANDSVGSANGTLVNGASVSGGQLVITNNNITSGAANVNYASLPVSAMMTSSPTVTFEEWFSASYDYKPGSTSAIYIQNRAFDLNNDTLNSDTSISTGAGQYSGSYLFESVDQGQGHSAVSIAPQGYGNANSGVTGGTWLDQPGSSHMIAVTIDQNAGSSGYGQMSYYVDGALIGSVDLNASTQWTFVGGNLTQAWLGRSAFSGDGVLNGTIDEFRVYDNAQSAAQVSADYVNGPNVVPEPASLGLLAVGAMGLVSRRRRRA